LEVRVIWLITVVRIILFLIFRWEYNYLHYK